MGRDCESVVGGGVAGERGGLLLLLGRGAVEVVARCCGGGDADVVVLLLLHGAVVGGLGEAEVVVRHPLAAEGAFGYLAGGERPGEAALVELAARAVGAVEVGADQIWSKALLQRGRGGGGVSDRESIIVCGGIRLVVTTVGWVR